MAKNSELKYEVKVWMSSEKNPGAMSWYKAPSEITYKLEKQLNLETTAPDSSNITTINIDANKKYQSILGIGTSI